MRNAEIRVALKARIECDLAFWKHNGALEINLVTNYKKMWHL